MSGKRYRVGFQHVGSGATGGETVEEIEASHPMDAVMKQARTIGSLGMINYVTRIQTEIHGRVMRRGDVTYWYVVSGTSGFTYRVSVREIV